MNKKELLEFLDAVIFFYEDKAFQNSEEEQALPKQAESLTTHQAPKLHPDVEQCLKFDTIYNL